MSDTFVVMQSSFDLTIASVIMFLVCFVTEVSQNNSWLLTLSLSDGKSEQISFVNWIVVIWSHCTFIHMIVGKRSKLPNDMLKALEDFSVIAKYKSLQNLFLNIHFPKCLNWNKEHPYFECMKFDKHCGIKTNKNAKVYWWGGKYSTLCDLFPSRIFGSRLDVI